MAHSSCYFIYISASKFPDHTKCSRDLPNTSGHDFLNTAEQVTPSCSSILYSVIITQSWFMYRKIQSLAAHRKLCSCFVFVTAPLENIFLKSFSSVSCSLKWIKYVTCSDSCYSVTIFFFFLLNCFFHICIEWSDVYNQDTAASAMRSFGDPDKPFAVCSGRPDTWANTAAQWSVISYGKQHQPGRFCQSTKENASN